MIISIIFFENSLSDSAQRVIDQSPAFELPISKQSLEEHINGPNLLRLREGTIPHFGSFLQEQFPTRITNTRFVLIPRICSKYRYFLSFFNGYPSERYGNYIINHLDGNIITEPSSIPDLIRTELLLSNLWSPLRSTLQELNSQTNYFSSLLHANTLLLYLDDTKSLDLSTSYWNERVIGRCNTLFLPRKDFLKQLHAAMTTILEVMPSITAVEVYTITSVNNAKKIHGQLVDTLKNFHKEIPIMVNYDTFKYRYLPRYYYTDRPLVFTQALSPDRSVRFRPTPPKGHTSSSDNLFGYDAEVRLPSGVNLSLPETIVSSVLLSNEIERIRRAEADAKGWGNLWLRGRQARVGEDGVTGLAIPNKESRFYHHEPETIISEHIKLAGIEVKPNKHTRYAQGLLRRLGGFDKAMHLLRLEPLAILEALMSHRAMQHGFFLNQILSYLRSKNIPNPQEVVNQRLPELIATGLVRRGYAIKCNNCDLQDWYPLEIIGAPLRCNGCAEPLSLHISAMPFAYTANELARRFVESGGLAIFMAADVLQDIDLKSLIHFGGDLIRKGEKSSFAEVDIFWLSENVLSVVECKSYKNIDHKAIQEFQGSLHRLFSEVTGAIEAKVIILCVSTEQIKLDINRVVSRFAIMGKRVGIGVHLILNSKFYLWGTDEISDIARLDISDLLSEKKRVSKKKALGETPRTIGFGGLSDALEDDIIKQWLRLLSQKSGG